MEHVLIHGIAVHAALLEVVSGLGVSFVFLEVSQLISEKCHIHPLNIVLLSNLFGVLILQPYIFSLKLVNVDVFFHDFVFQSH